MPSKKKRKTIAFLLNQMDHMFFSTIWKTVHKRCIERDINMVLFLGKPFESQRIFEYQENPVYSMIDPELYDGILCATPTLSVEIGLARFDQFLEKFQSIPILSLTVPLTGKPYVSVNNHVGMFDLVTHLIQHHRYTKIAFICGPQDSVEAAQRFQAYLDALMQNGLNFDPQYVFQGTFINDSGERAICEMYDNRKLRPDAIVAANDQMALGALDELRRHGISVPDDVALVGFDDIELTQFSNPPLTTVHQPSELVYKMGVDLLIDMIEGKKDIDSIEVKSHLVLRQSCGCLPLPTDFKHGPEPYRSQAEILHDIDHLTDELLEIFTTNVGATEAQNSAHQSDYLQLIEHLQSDLKKGTPKGKFIKTLNRKASHSFYEEHESLNWEKALVQIKNYLEPIYAKIEAKQNAFYQLFENAQSLCSDLRFRVEGFNRNVVEFTDMEKRHFLTNLNGVVNIDEMLSKTAQSLVHLKIPTCWISVMESDPVKLNITDYQIAERSRNLLTLENGVALRTSPSPDFYRTKDIVPGGFSEREDRFSLAVRILYSQDSSHGFIVFGLNSTDEGVYITSHLIISSALHTLFLWRTRVEAEKALQIRTEELEIKNKQLSQLDNLKNDFIANITHDFRSPLTVIMGLSELGQSAENSDDFTEYFDLIRQSSQKLKKSIDRLLDLAKMEAQGVAIQYRKLNIVGFLQSVVNYYSSAIQSRGIQVQFSYQGPDFFEFFSDYEKLEEVMNNLLSNAIKFVDSSSGIITITLDFEPEGIVISVCDNGIGIPQKQLLLIFDRFEQAHKGRDSRYGGTGIGLAFSKQIVEALGGKIWAESEGAGKGATFRIQLPRHRFDEEPKEPDLPLGRSNADLYEYLDIELKTKFQKDTIQVFCEDSENSIGRDYKKALILVIDDDIEITKIVMGYLRSRGFRNFVIANTGKLGLDAVYRYQPHIVICDYNMPDLRGDKIHDELMEHPVFKKVPFLFLSAISDPKLIAQRRERGAQAFLKKPIDPSELIFSVEQKLKEYFEFYFLLQLANLDELSGIHNKRSILKRLEDELAQRHFRELSVVVLDIDRFSSINDEFGHPAGDRLIQEMGGILGTRLRGYDISGRYSGDEFIVVLPDTNTEKAAETSAALASKIEAIEMTFENRKLKITSSFGIVSLKEQKTYIEKTLKIPRLEDVFEPANPNDADWQKIMEQKSLVAELLVQMARSALRQAKRTLCQECGYQSERESEFAEGSCPQCRSRNLLPGRNRIAVFTPDRI